LYSTDLAFVHDDGFGELAERAALDIVRLLHARGIDGGTIVELGCGSGITAAHLIASGYDVVGFDISPAMIRLARSRAPAARLRVASIDSARIPRCRAAIAVGEVITYLPGGLPALIRLFRRIRASLPPAGVLIFDFIESAARRTYAPTSRGGAGWAIVSRARYDRARRILTREIVVVRRAKGKVRGSRETHHVRIYGRAEIRSALARAGFTVRMSQSYGRRRLLSGDVVAVAQAV